VQSSEETETTTTLSSTVFICSFCAVGYSSQDQLLDHLTNHVDIPHRQGWKKTRVFKKKNQPSGVFCFFWGFLGFFGFFCPEERVLGFFSVSRILLGASRL
jgi:hypothetical protein